MVGQTILKLLNGKPTEMKHAMFNCLRPSYMTSDSTDDSTSVSSSVSSAATKECEACMEATSELRLPRGGA